MVTLRYNGSKTIRAFGEELKRGDVRTYDEARADLLLRHPEFEIVESETPVALTQPQPITVIVPTKKAQRIGRKKQ